MRKIYLLLLLSFAIANSTNAQSPSIGRSYGKITDSLGQPMSQVSAIVLKTIVADTVTKTKKLVLLKGMDTKTNGEFNFEDLPVGSPLVLRVSSTGFKSQDLFFQDHTNKQ